MIEVKDIATKYQTMLNSNNLGYEFIVYADMGDLVNGTTNNSADTKIAGLVDFLPSEIFGTGAKILNINTRLTLYLNAIHTNKTNYTQQIEDVKQVLNGIIATYNKVPQTYALNGTNYNLTMNFSLPQNLSIINLGYLTRCLPVELYITLSAVINGVSSKDKKYYLNGELLEVLSGSTTRARATETNSHDGENSTTSVEQTNSISFNIMVPFLSESPYTLIYEDLMRGIGNDVQLLQINVGSRWDNYMVVFNQTSDSLQEGLNIGFNVSFVEADTEIVDFGDDWTQEYFKTIDVNGTEFDVTSVRATNTSNATIVVFWGDNSSNIMAIGETITHTYTDDITGHNVIVYGTATLLPIFQIYDLSAEQNQSIVGYLYESDIVNINYPENPSLILEVIGEGEIIDYTSSAVIPYYSYRNYITELILSDDITKIGNYAFSGLQEKRITIPKNCLVVGVEAFTGVGRNDFEGIDFSSNEVLTTIGASAFEKGGATYSLEEGFNLILPNSVETIGNLAFAGLIRQNLIGNLINLGENITSIGNLAFIYANIEEVIINSATPPIIDYGIFGDGPIPEVPYTEMVLGNCVIRVPAESVSAYKSAWTEYADYIYAIE